MAADAAMFSKLNAVSEITGGVYPGYAPQSAALPYAVYSVFSDRPHRFMQGSCSLAEAEYQVSVYAETLDSANTVTEAIRGALDGVQGVTIAGISVRRISLTNQRNATTLFDSSQDQTVEIQMDFTIYYLRSETPST